MTVRARHVAQPADVHLQYFNPYGRERIQAARGQSVLEHFLPWSRLQHDQLVSGVGQRVALSLKRHDGHKRYFPDMPEL